MAINSENEKRYEGNRNADDPKTGLNKNVDSNENTHMLPEDDPAVINPDELATFPKEKRDPDADIEEQRNPHLASKVHTSARDGRNITNTGTKPDDNGFL